MEETSEVGSSQRKSSHVGAVLVGVVMVGLVILVVAFDYAYTVHMNREAARMIDRMRVEERQRTKVAMAKLAQDQGFVLLNQGEQLPGSQMFLACSKASGLLYTGSLTPEGNADWEAQGERVETCSAR